MGSPLPALDLDRDAALAVASIEMDIDRRREDAAARARARYAQRKADDPEFLKHRAAKERALYYSKHKSERIRKNRNSSKIDAPTRMLRAAYQRARMQGLPFNLTIGLLRQLMPSDARCPVFGFRMLSGGGTEGQERAPSLDRISPSRGYVEGNVRVISTRANRIKGDGTTLEHEQIAAYMKANDAR